MTPHLRRLWSDQRRILSAFESHPYIRLVETEGNPPERYIFEFHVAGLAPRGEDGFVAADCHRAEVILLRDYPRRAPFCRMMTPVFHPNIDPQKICIGDHWSAGESLAHLVVRIAEMICYQSYNIKSPLNGRAAAWAEENLAQLPIQEDELTVGH